MGNTIKNIIHLIISAITAVLMIFSSCLDNSEEYKAPDQQAEETQNEIMECFTSKDSEKLKEMFCTYVQQNDEKLDEEIQAAFDFLDGEIVSYDEAFSDFGGGESDESGWKTQSCFAKTTNVITTQGTNYTIEFAGYLIYRDNIEKQGVFWIYIRNENKFQEYSKNSKKEKALNNHIDSYYLKIGLSID
jgi:hypothetical protein